MIIDTIIKTDIVLGKSISFDLLLTIDKIENKINKSIIVYLLILLFKKRKTKKQ